MKVKANAVLILSIFSPFFLNYFFHFYHHEMYSNQNQTPVQSNAKT